MTEQDIVQLFARFQARYGHKWTSQQTTPDMVRLAVAEWADGLADLGAEHLRHGLASWDGDWPPSLPEFRRACLATELPTSNQGWLEVGKRIGCLPAPGEEWPQYIARTRRALQRASRSGGDLASAANDAPALTGPRKALGHD